MENVVFNIGCTTKNGVEMNVEAMINAIGERTNCTITRTVAFIKGKTHFITGDMPDSDFFDVVIDFEKE